MRRRRAPGGAPSTSYLPFLYTERGKRPGQHYLLHNVLLEDVALLVLAFAWSMEHPVPGALGLLVLHMSFWAVYEVGYHENDHVATARERRPHVPAGAEAYGERMKPWLAWITALVLAVPGIGLIAGFNPASSSILEIDGTGVDRFAGPFLVWALYLVAARTVFWVYNRIDVHSRGLLYAGLQLSRTVGYAVLVEVNLVGALALAALVFARWVPYLTYRGVGTHWRGSYRMVLLSAFVVLGFVGIAVDADAFIGIQALVVLAWMAVLVRRELLTAVRRVVPT